MAELHETFVGPVATFDHADGNWWEPWHPFVSRDTYESVDCTQVVVGGATFPLAPGQHPVVLRGSRHCMVRKWSSGGPRWHATAVLERYIRMKRITCCDPHEWYRYVNGPLCELFYRRDARGTCRPISYGQNKTLDDIGGMVSQWSVLVDGRVVSCHDRARRSMLRMLDRALRAAEAVA